MDVQILGVSNIFLSVYLVYIINDSTVFPKCEVVVQFPVPRTKFFWKSDDFPFIRFLTFQLLNLCVWIINTYFPIVRYKTSQLITKIIFDI